MVNWMKAPPVQLICAPLQGFEMIENWSLHAEEFGWLATQKEINVLEFPENILLEQSYHAISANNRLVFEWIKPKIKVTSKILDEWVSLCIGSAASKTAFQAHHLLSEFSDLLPIEGRGLSLAISQNNIGLFSLVLMCSTPNKYWVDALRSACIDQNSFFQDILIEVCPEEIVNDVFSSLPNSFYLNWYQAQKSNHDQQEINAHTPSIHQASKPLRL